MPTIETERGLRIRDREGTDFENGGRLAGGAARTGDLDLEGAPRGP